MSIDPGLVTPSTLVRPEPPAPRRPRRSSWGRSMGLAVGLVAVLLLLVTAFVWPAMRTAPRDVPLAVAGSEAQIAQVSEALEAAQPGAFAVTVVADEAAARAAIAARDVYGALLLSPTGATMLTAPGASPAVATALEGVAAALNTRLLDQQGVSVPTAVGTEVAVAGSAADPRGSGFASLVLPLVIGSLLSGVAVSLIVTGASRRLVALLVIAAGGGLVIAWAAGPWLGVVTGGYAAQSGVLALTVLAVAGAVVGAHGVLGRVGIAVMAPVLLLLGNPLSAAASAPEMLPAGWAGLGQALPPGAAVQALRSVAFFDGAGAGRPLMVLAIWVAAALGLVLLGGIGIPRMVGEDV